MFALDRELDADIAQLEQAKASLTPDQIAERLRYQAAMRARVDRFAMAHAEAVEAEAIGKFTAAMRRKMAAR